MTLINAAALVWLLMSATEVQAQPLTGMELYTWCKSQNDAMNAECTGYLTGFGDGLVVGQQLMGYQGGSVCMPKGVSAGQMVLMYQKAARQHPELLNQSAQVLATRTLLDAYRCKPGQKPAYGD